MNNTLFIIFAIAVLLYGCTTAHDNWPTNGTLEVNYHVPPDLAGHEISTYLNGECLASGTITSVVSRKWLYILGSLLSSPFSPHSPARFDFIQLVSRPADFFHHAFHGRGPDEGPGGLIPSGQKRRNGFL